MPSQASVESRGVRTGGGPRRVIAEPGPQLHKVELIHLGEGLAWVEAEAELHGQRRYANRWRERGRRPGSPLIQRTLRAGPRARSDHDYRNLARSRSAGSVPPPLVGRSIASRRKALQAPFPFRLVRPSVGRMHARVPQDVDLEDKLIYGLSPLRFGYLVVAALGVLSLWHLEAVPVGLRLLPCFVVAAGAALLAWGRWRGRPLDAWLLDLIVFARRNYRLHLSWEPRDRQSVVPLRAMNSLGKPSRRDAAAPPDLPEAA